MLGSSPADTGVGAAGGSGAGGVGGSGGGGSGGSDYYFYQAEDGQWLFLSPLNLRMLLAHYGSYAACPPTITAKVLEVEDVTQDESSRRRMRVLGHLPLTATFKLCEADLSGLLPPSALAQFSDELAQREKKRAQRAKQEARLAKQERAAAAAAAAAAANTGMSAAELRAMPLPAASLLPAAMDPEAAEDAAAAAAAAASVTAAAGVLSGAAEGDEGEDMGEGPTPAPPQAGVSFARMARYGFAASGPSLSSQTPPSISATAGPPGASPSVPPAAALPGPRGVWGAKPAAAAPAWGAAAGPEAAIGLQQQLGGLQIGGNSKGGKGKKLLLFGATQRKY